MNPSKIFTLALLAGVLLLSGCTSQAPEAKVYHVGILSGMSILNVSTDGFKAKMAELGYVEGQNIVYDLQATDDMTAFNGILRKFMDEKVDLIFTYPTEPALAAKAAVNGTGIPVVFSEGFIEDNGLIDSIREPGGNITGVRYPSTEYTVKRLEILHEMAPNTKRVWITYAKNYPANPPAVKALRESASSLNMTLVEVPVTSVEEIFADLQNRSESSDPGIDAILMIPDYLSAAPDSQLAICKFADEHKLPVGSPMVMSIPECRSIFGYTSDYFEDGQLAAALADKILRGTPAGTIPVISPNAHLEINYKVAQELGLNVSESLLSRAEKIIR